MFALYVERDGLRGLLRLEPYAIVGVRDRRAALWLSWAAALGQTTGLTFGLTDKLFDAGILFDHGYWVKMTRRLVKDLFGPIGIVAAAIGLVAVWRARRMMEIALLLGGAAYLIIVTPGNYHHDYYQIPLVSGVAVLAGVGLTRGTRSAWIGFGREVRDRNWRSVVMAFWLLPMTTLIRSVSPHNWYQIDVDRAALCSELRPALRQRRSRRVLGQQSPDVMFCTGSRGWLIQAGPGLSDRLAMALRDGATVVVSPRQAVHTLPPAILATLPVADSADLVAFRVPRATASTSP